MIPVLLKPKFYTFKNRWTHTKLKLAWGKDFFVGLFSLIVMAGMYFGTTGVLLTVQKNSHIAYVHPSLLLSIFLLMFFMMLLFSNSVAALGTLFMAKDLEMILSAPVHTFRFFSGKLMKIVLNSSWMGLVFCVPVLLSFSEIYQASLTTIVFSLLLLVPFFVIPSCFAVALIITFSRFVPLTRTKEILVGIAGLAVVGFYFFAQLFTGSGLEGPQFDSVVKLLSMSAAPHKSWLPSYWAATCVGQLLDPNGINFLPHLALLFTTAAGLASLTYILIRQFHHRAYCAAQEHRVESQYASKASQERLIKLTPFLSPFYRAILNKELKNFTREMSHTLQLLLLVGLSVIYLYNFKLLQPLSHLPEATKMWWHAMLVFVNVGMGAFVTTAVCTRFVFPSISFEGQGFWIIATAPVHAYELLRAKFWTWLFPIATISSVIFASGALAVQADFHIVCINALSSWVITYGLVGLAVGIGAMFASFDWEDISQVTASLGSLFYMLSAMGFILINLFPAGCLIFVRTLRNQGIEFSHLQWYSYVGLSALLLVYINFITTRWALTAGAQALEKRIS